MHARNRTRHVGQFLTAPPLSPRFIPTPAAHPPPQSHVCICLPLPPPFCCTHHQPGWRDGQPAVGARHRPLLGPVCASVPAPPPPPPLLLCTSPWVTIRVARWAAHSGWGARHHPPLGTVCAPDPHPPTRPCCCAHPPQGGEMGSPQWAPGIVPPLVRPLPSSVYLSPPLSAVHTPSGRRVG